MPKSNRSAGEIRDWLKWLTSEERQRESEQFRRDCEFFETNRYELLERYPDRWVAIFQEKVLGSGKTQDHLIKRLRRKGFDVTKVIYRKLETERRTIIVSAAA